jgi:hypothetical protein
MLRSRRAAAIAALLLIALALLGARRCPLVPGGSLPPGIEVLQDR